MMDYLANMALLCGFCFLLTAAVMKLFPPKKINSLYGYRTARSMASDEQWQFAQSYSTVRMFEVALFLLLFGVIAEMSDWTPETKMASGSIASLIVIIYMIWRTEYALKRKFPN